MGKGCANIKYNKVINRLACLNSFFFILIIYLDEGLPPEASDDKEDTGFQFLIGYTYIVQVRNQRMFMCLQICALLHTLENCNIKQL